jgi:hypothetical protein
VWLNDSRRLLLADGDRVVLTDSETGKTREIFSVSPHILGVVAASQDNRTIYFALQITEADVWLTTLH